MEFLGEMLKLKSLARGTYIFYLVPRGGKVPLLNIAKTRATEKRRRETKWLARWVGLGTTIARKAVALEAERFGGPKEQNV